MKKFNVKWQNFDDALIANGFEEHYYDDGSSYMVARLGKNKYIVVESDTSCWGVTSHDDITDDEFLELYAGWDANKHFDIEELPIVMAFGIR